MLKEEAIGKFVLGNCKAIHCKINKKQNKQKKILIEATINQRRLQRYKIGLTNLRLLQPANSARKISSHMKTAFPLLMKSFLNSPFVHRENYQWEKSSCGSLTVR